MLLSVVMGVGAIAGLIANPIVGALSDRTTSPRGRRHPWTVGCALVAALGLAVVAASPAVAVMAVGWFIAELGLGGMLATLTAALPDRVPVSQRGHARRADRDQPDARHRARRAARHRDHHPDVGRLRGLRRHRRRLRGRCSRCELRTSRCPSSTSRIPPVSTTLRRMWVSPRDYPDFGWGWLTHFLINLGNDLGTLYLLYFLARSAHYHDPQTGLLILMALYAVALLAAGSASARCRTSPDAASRSSSAPRS